MKQAIKIIISLIIIAVIFTLFSCEANNHPYEVKHSIIIDIEDANYYQFADISSNASNHYDDLTTENGEELPGGHQYSYIVEGKEITVTSLKRPLEVQLYHDGVSPKYRLLEVENNTFKYTVNKYEHIVVVFERWY